MHYFVVGMGKSGQAVAKRLHEEQVPFATFDENMTSQEIDQLLDQPEGVHFQEFEAIKPEAYRQVVVSPGVSFHHPLLKRFREHGVPIIGEMEFGFQRNKGKIVAVTGSNGKSTTVSMIHHVLTANGLNSRLCGNIGKPFTACVDEDETAIYVLEVSSFQLEHVERFVPDIGILLNIAPDHLDRHGNFEAYREAKLRLFKLQQPNQWSVYPAGFEPEPPGQGRRMPVPSEDACWKEHTICVGDSFRLDSQGLPLLGHHNRSNALFTCLVANYFHLTGDQVGSALASFKGLPHRLEVLGQVQGRRWINDSKATNVHATQAAVEAMDQPYVLILGGCDKGERFHELGLQNNPPLAIVAYGETAPMICEDLAGFNPEIVADFSQASLRAHQLAGAGQTVLLAPACASFDQFQSFVHRGDCFRDLFAGLGES